MTTPLPSKKHNQLWMDTWYSGLALDQLSKKSRKYVPQPVSRTKKAPHHRNQCYVHINLQNPNFRGSNNKLFFPVLIMVSTNNIPLVCFRFWVNFQFAIHAHPLDPIVFRTRSLRASIRQKENIIFRPKICGYSFPKAQM